MMNSKLISSCHVSQDSFADLMELIRVTCLELQYSEAVVNEFLEVLIRNKYKLCSGCQEWPDNKSKRSAISEKSNNSTSLMQALN